MEHGGDIYTDGILKGRELLDFSSNINPLGVPESFKRNLQEALDNIERYPDAKYRKLKKYLKDYVEFSKSYFYASNKKDTNSILNIGNITKDHSNIIFETEDDIESTYSPVNENDIVLGNGAAEIIDLVISCFDRVCIPVPSFIEYEQNASKWGCSIQYSYLKEDMTYDYKDIALKMKGLDALVIGNPNNPNGMVIEKKEFMPILDYCEENNKVVIVDEAFIEFTGKRGFSLLKELEKYNCLFIIRALTKFYSIPGVRIGYGISKNETLIEGIKNKQNPWNINCFAEVAAKYVLKDKEYIENSIKWIEEEREFVGSELEKLEFMEKVYETYSNFILCKLKNINCDELYKLCLDRGIVIRKCDNFKRLDKRYIRLAIKDRKNNERVMEVLRGLSML